MNYIFIYYVVFYKNLKIFKTHLIVYIVSKTIFNMKFTAGKRLNYEYIFLNIFKG